MKTTNKFLIVTMAMTLLAGCSFFDNDSPSASSPEMIFSNLSDTERSIAAVYELFGNDRGYRNRLACGYAGINTDIEYCRKTGDAQRYQTKVTDSELSNAKGNDAWGYLNAMIERCNNIVDGIDAYGYPAATAKDSAKYDYLKGEALFLRAFALLELVKYWGDVPVNIHAYDGKSIDAVATAKVDRNIAFEQIRTDLKLAAELMNWSASAQVASAVNDVRRPSKAAALALLARADLMYAGRAVRPTVCEPGCSTYSVTWNVPDQSERVKLYQEVMWACDTIIREEGDTKLLDDYARVFRNVCEDKTDYASMEQIWVIPFANGARGQVMNYNCLKFNTKKVEDGKLTDYSVMGVQAHNVEYNDDVKSNFSMSMIPTLLFDFDENDLRLPVTICPYRWKVSMAGAVDPTIDPQVDPLALTIPCLYPEPQSDAAQWACGKYRLEWMARDNTSADDGIDFPIIRMADVYLMYAEAATGSVDQIPVSVAEEHPEITRSASEAFNKVRARAGLPTLSPTLENIQEERKFEFAGEYIRKWDLMRWGILKEKMEETRVALQDLRETEDGKYLYFTYKRDDSAVQAGATHRDRKIERGYVVDKIFLDDNKPGKSSAASGGYKKCNFSEKLAEDVYILYDYSNPECLESRQYWPIFSTILGASGGKLFNNYGY